MSVLPSLTWRCAMRQAVWNGCDTQPADHAMWLWETDDEEDGEEEDRGVWLGPETVVLGG